jgi:hypothetical protein
MLACLKKEASEASPDPGANQARKDKQALRANPLALNACLSLYGIHGILKFH